MLKPDAEYAMVRRHSKSHKTLLTLGWMVTDADGEWLHMEPLFC